MKTRAYLLTVLIAFCWLAAEGVARAGTDKFIPTFTIKYCGTGSGVLSTQQTAQFDMLVVSPSHHSVWGENGKNSWESLKAYNPDMIILLYGMGPGKYNASSWGQMGAGWDWMKQNHGVGAGADRWTGSGLVYDYLANSDYPNERMMFLGHADWQEYWYQTLVDDWWGGAKGDDHTGASGIFADCTGYRVTNTDRWFHEDHVGDPSYQDHPADYYQNTAYDHDLWKVHMNEFFGRAVPALESRGLYLVPNFGHMATHQEYWTELGSQPHPPNAAMEEAGFVKSYGNETFNYHEWPQKLSAMSSLQNLAVLMTCHGKQLDQAEGLERMDLVGTDGATGWDALWFAMTSFLLALNQDQTNGYLGFTIWGYCEYHWLDEYDPQYLHLGNPVGTHFQEGDLFFREYEDGWVVVNPTTKDTSDVAVPGGEARVLSHETFKNADGAPAVNRFDLPAHRGVVLLKPGRKAGNEDNIAPPDDGESAGGDDGGEGGNDDGGGDASDFEPTTEENDSGTIADGDAAEAPSGSCGCSSKPCTPASLALLVIFIAPSLRRLVSQDWKGKGKR
jgi:hypothetical protein